MWNIMKAQNYQTRGDKLVIVGLLFALLLPVIVMITSGDSSTFEALNGGLYLVMAATSFSMVALVLVLLISARICGWDSVDKTINYEILAGHSRAQVYFGRVLLALFWTMGASLFTMGLPVLIVSLFCGFGSNMEIGGVLLHTGLFLLVLFRISCEFMLIAFLLQNCYAAMLLDYVITMFATFAAMLLKEFLDIKTTFFTAFINMLHLFSFDNFQMKMVGGEEIQVFHLSLESSFIWGTAAASLLVGGLCIAVGYLVFSKRDFA